MKHPRRLMAVAILTAAIALTAMAEESTAGCFQCQDGITTLAGSNCWDLADGWRHDQGSQVYFPFFFGGRAMSHQNATAYYCGDCDVHAICADDEPEPPPPEGDEDTSEEGGLSVFDSEPAKLLAAVEKMDADHFVEQSSGRLVILNCRGGIAHQYKLTADQIAVLSAAPEDVAATDD